MGLAGPKVKTKVGLDPRNTFWTTNTENFGHKYLSNLGWTPGTALGDKNSSYHSSGHISSASHTGVKIILKDDTLGIGAKKGAQDGECTGLLGLEGLLGRLNGDDAKVQRVKQEEERRKQEWVGGRYGVRFVRGEVWTGEDFTKLMKKDSGETKKVEEESKDAREDKKKEKKRKRDEGEAKEKRSKRERSASEDASSKRSKSRSKSKSKTPSADEDSSNDDTPAEPSEDGSKNKKRKKADKGDDDRPEESKKERKKRRKAEKEERRARRAEKKSRKEKAKAQKEEDSSSSDESETETAASGSATPVSTASSQVQKRVLVGRHAIRARFIAAKRSAVMDSAALNEILMIKA